MNKGKKKGSALYFVLMIMSILMILGVAISALSISNYKMRKLSDNKVRVLYEAESGIDEAYIIINNEANKIINEEKFSYYKWDGKKNGPYPIMENIINRVGKIEKYYYKNVESEYDSFSGMRTTELSIDGLNISVTSTFKESNTNIEKEVSEDLEIVIDPSDFSFKINRKNWTIVK